jgi:hypothetical protein
MAKYRVQRLYSDEENSGGMGTLGKVALGAAALGGGLMAGKAGLLGTTVQKGIGTGMAKTGNLIGSQAMINSGASTVGKAAATNAAKGYGITLSKSGAQAAKETLVKADASTAFKDIAKQRVDAVNSIKDRFKLPAQAAFSEDTSGALREAALIGTGLTMVGGGMYLAKKGKLGFTKAQRDTNKKAYDKISGEIKKIVSETKKESGKPAETTTVAETTTKAAGKKPKTTVVVEKSIPKYKDSDWKNIRRELKGTGGDFRNPSDVAKAAAKVGAKPL